MKVIPMNSIVTRYPVLKLDVTLMHMPEPVFRKLLVRTGTSLRELHHIIQAVMRWDNAHLYEFNRRVGDGVIRYCDTAMWDGDVPLENDDMLYFVEDLFKSVGDGLTYVYDLGDHWEHRIVLENIFLDPFIFPVLPAVAEGSGVCPPEDCGGVQGYIEMRKTLEGKKGKKYMELKGWLDAKGWGDRGFNIDMCSWELNNMKHDMTDFYFNDDIIDE